MLTWTMIINIHIHAHSQSLVGNQRKNNKEECIPSTPWNSSFSYYSSSQLMSNTSWIKLFAVLWRSHMVKKYLYDSGSGFTIALSIRYQGRMGDKSSWDRKFPCREFLCQNISTDFSFIKTFLPGFLEISIIYFVSSLGVDELQ